MGRYKHLMDIVDKRKCAWAAIIAEGSLTSASAGAHGLVQPATGVTDNGECCCTWVRSQLQG